MYGKSENRDDYQDVPRPVAAMARNLPDGHHIPAHRHRRAQLIYGTSGAITVATDHGVWVVPATRGAWLPAGLTHAMTCAGAVAMRTLYIEPASAGHLPAHPTVVSVPPLLRELMDEATRLPVEYDTEGRDGKVMELLLLELAPHPVPALRLPAPEDPQLAALCAEIRREPAAPWTTPRAAARARMSPRSLQRRFPDATGMSLAHWVQQSRLVHAVTLLARGEPVTAVAGAVGYATPSAFTAMFHRALGTTPTAYFGGSPERAGSTERSGGTGWRGPPRAPRDVTARQA
ncbi:MULTISPECIES: helix-turn-helix transcriptional regulator [unclassified Streptomyces]|uniref:AraC family transcriptional regulator n=1 Tax=unclassified Streptomyces TaxID=2593676 RepID=UPI002DD9DECF|nr:MULTISPECIES: helix-turn-helix transcriptional regulator [unclassified Streptomyces]WSB80400.1 helix-turn-helix transcriptional regulator [Streptomyces sp. NBC_01775]WSS11395.1 helix-turn-helix transcriptional regulator [Streptomyces sp. NBC_01186]WSS40101.1 helix-turn-helix transcriptional regulator [Streptomyces sp. NBC_01187]